MAWADQIQNKVGTGSSTSPSVTMDSSITEGNLIIVFCETGDGTLTAPSGYSTAVDSNNTTESDRFAIFYKVAGASESTTITASTSGSDEWAMHAFEYEGPWESSPLDLGESEARDGSTTSYLCNPTGTTSQNDELAVVGAYTRNTASDDSDSWDSGYTLVASTQSANKTLHGAVKVLTATGSVSSTLSIPSATVVMGGGCSFKKQGAGGGLSIPIAAYHYNHNVGSNL